MILIFFFFLFFFFFLIFQIWYLAGDRPKLPVEFKYISKEKLDVGKLRAQNMTGMNLQYSQIALKEIE